MCPEREILSAYYDGEVHAPLNKRLEAHIAACPVCQATLESFALCGSALSNSAVDTETSKKRCWERIEQERDVRRIPDIWHKRIIIPTPLAAAAVLLLFLGAGFLLFKNGGLEKNGSKPLVADSSYEHTITPASFENMNALLNYLDSQKSNDFVTIQLPKGAKNFSTGEPLLVRGKAIQGK